MIYGYYYQWGRYGDFPQPAAWTNTDVLSYAHFSRGFPGDPPEGADEETSLARLRKEVKRSVRAQRGICLGLDMKDGAPWPRILKRASKPFWTMPATRPWDSIRLLDLSDEPTWTVQQQNEKAGLVRAELARLGIPAPPIGSVFGYKDPGLKTSDRFDWVGLEAYLEPPGRQYRAPGGAVLLDELYSDVTARLREEYGKRANPSRHAVVVVMQGYDRNREWTYRPALRALQRATVEVAQDLFGPDLLGFLIFAYGRDGGTIYYPGVEAIHQDLARELPL